MKTNAISRREALRRASLLTVGSGLPFGFTACAEQGPADWRIADLAPLDAPGYGTDPDLIHIAPAPWPTTLTDQERATFSVLADILIPADGDLPAASQVGVVEVIDEWVSAPYPDQQQHRALLLSGIDWCDREARRRFSTTFASAAPAEQIAIIEEIAYPEGAPELEGPRLFFAGLRRLVTGAYYTSPEGVRELDYQGNIAIAGDYPGPTDEAMAHLNEQLERLGLELQES
ncbi:MAG: gluconate 2-dehydrogenase subunit 3 family protein [Gammaproteobacteria bacterium]|nr:MAG: gluconate 2-dehydrogenase subunit 3 family protein [Gammaproteobacteria bacterium]